MGSRCESVWIQKKAIIAESLEAVDSEALPGYGPKCTFKNKLLEQTTRPPHSKFNSKSPRFSSKFLHQDSNSFRCSKVN
jgi:hypothetical protein